MVLMILIFYDLKLYSWLWIPDFEILKCNIGEYWRDIQHADIFKAEDLN